MSEQGKRDRKRKNVMATDPAISLAALKEQWLSEAARLANRKGVPQFERNPERSQTLIECAEALTPHLQAVDIADNYVTRLHQKLAEQQAEVGRLRDRWETTKAAYDMAASRAEAAESALSALRQDHDALKQQHAEARQALKDYGQHKPTCGALLPREMVRLDICTCGLSAVLAVDQEPLR